MNEHHSGVTISRAPVDMPAIAWVQQLNTCGGSGMDVTPIVAVGKVFAFDCAGTVYAFDEADGHELWRYPTGEGNIQKSTPVFADGKLLVASGSGKIYQFTADTGTLLWCKKISNSSFESPLTYHNGAIFIGEGLAGSRSTKHFLSVSTENGDVLWSYPIENTTGFLWDGAVVVNNSVIFPVMEGLLVSLNASNGELTDRVDLKNGISFNRSDLGLIRDSVVYNNGSLYVSSEKGQRKGYVFKIRYDNGRFIDEGWSSPIGFSTSSPVVLDGRVYVGQGEHGNPGKLICLDDATGRIIWEFPVSDGVKASPAVSVCSGKPYIYFPEAAITNGSVYCLRDDRSLAWEFNPPDDAYILQGCTLGDGVYFGTDAGRLYCLRSPQNGTAVPETAGSNARDGDNCSNMGRGRFTGKPIVDAWEQFHHGSGLTGFSLSGAPENGSLAWVSDNISAVNYSSPIEANGVLFVNCNDSLVSLDASTGRMLWQVPVSGDTTGSGTWSSPAYRDGRVFLPNDGARYASNGSHIWSGLPWTIDGSPLVAEGMVFQGDWDGRIYNPDNSVGGHYYAFDELTGEQVWKFNVTGYAQGTPSISAGRLFLTSNEYHGEKQGYIYCVDPASGCKIWEQSVDLIAGGSPAVADGIVYVTGYNFDDASLPDGSLYALSANNGTLLWTRPIQRSFSTPAVAYGKVYVCGGARVYGSKSENTCCFDAYTGKVIWETNDTAGIGDYIFSVAVADGKVFTFKQSANGSGGSRGLYALDAETGEIKWHGGYGCSSPAIANQTLYTIDGGRVYAYRDTPVHTSEGKRLDVKGDVYSTPATSPGACR